MDADHIIVIYNGRTVVDAHDSKLTNGANGLQLAHPEDARGADIEFRNLKLKRLPKREPELEQSERNPESFG